MKEKTVIVWIASYSRSGNTFFRIVLTHLYDVHTTAGDRTTSFAFDAGENMLSIGDGGSVVKHETIPAYLQTALRSRDSVKIRGALEEMDRSEKLFVIKTHAPPYKLFGVRKRVVLVVRDPRDAIASFANYFVDIPFDKMAIGSAWRRLSKWHLLNPLAWLYLLMAGTVWLMKRLGMRKRLVSKGIDRQLDAKNKNDSYLNWGLMNRAWLDVEPKPHIVRFDDLINEPVTVVQAAVKELGLQLNTVGREVPSFESLKSMYPNFFRKGRSGDWKNWMSKKQEELIWRDYGDVMQDLGFGQQEENSSSDTHKPTET